MKAPLPPDETERLAALRSLAALDAPPDPHLDDLVSVAARACDTPVSLVSLVDEDRQWFKARRGLDVRETPRDVAFCAHAILGRELLEVPDALLDERFAANPLVTGEPRIRFYAGAPLVTADGHAIGTLCVIDRVPRTLDASQRETLATLARAVASRLEHRRALERAAALAEERAEAAEALRAGEARLRLALSAAQAGAWEWDFRAGRGFWSDEDYRLLGYEPGSVAPSLESLFARVHPDDRDRARETLQRAVASGGAFECEYRVVLPDGAVRWMRDVGNVEADGAGRALRVLGIATDVTGRKLAERELLERGNELSAANAQLERAARLKDEFLAAMSHELRTPLNAVLGLSEGLAAGAFGPLTPEQEENVALIEESGRHLLDLINGILDLSKIGAGKLTLAPGPVDPSAICEAGLRMVREAALRKRIRLSSRFDPRLSWVLADPLRLRQILVNLLGNAVKFTPERGSVSVETAADPDGGRACIRVKDDGIGIAAEDLPRLFHPFVQLDSGLSREHAGTGLGLSLVLRLAELHGGGVSVESEPGAGSRFTVALPWSPEEQESLAAGAGLLAPPVPAPAPPALAPRPAGGEAPLVLVADDHEANVAALQAWLAAGGCRVAVARSGLEAVERALETRPDLVLMDVRMPGIDGLEATRRIRAREEGRRVPIVALTALVTAGDRERSLAAGADDFLERPVPPARLAEVVAGQLLRAAGGAEGERPLRD